MQNQLLLSQTTQALEEPPHDIRGGDYETSLNYQVEDEHLFGESSTTGMVRGPYWKPMLDQQYFQLPIVQ